MKLFLALHPLEFLLRYNVIAGIICATIGVAIYLMAKRITMAKEHKVEIARNNKTLVTLQCIAILFIIAGIILIALPFEATLYRG